MSMVEQAAGIETRDLARESVNRFLAAVVGGPYSDAWPEAIDLENQALALEAARSLQEADREAPAFAELIEHLHAPADRLRAAYDQVFGLVTSKDCPPYEAEYYPAAEPFARAQQMADVAGFYRAFGIEPSRRTPERPDHLALELEYLAYLLLMRRLARAEGDDAEARERASLCAEAYWEFFRDHLAWWVPAFAAALRRKAGRGYLEALGRVLAEWVPAECRRLELPSIFRPARPELIEPPDEQAGCAACPLQL